MNQRTIARQGKISGTGFFSGEEVNLWLLPSPINTGIAFLINGQVFSINTNNICQEALHTTSLEVNRKKVRNVEHFLSSLYGLKIDNVNIILDKDEVPYIKSSSAMDFIDVILNLGIIEQKAEVDPLIITKSLEYICGDSYAKVEPTKNKFLTITAEIEFPKPIGKQMYTFEHISEFDYVNEIGWARSFFRDDIWMITKTGITNWQRVKKIIPILPDKPIESPILCFDQGTWITHPFTESEPVCHKITDLIGDIALIGKRVWGKIFVHFPGHEFNHKMVKWILNNFL